MDAIRKIPELAKEGLKISAENHTIYHGYRWHFIPREAENIKYNIPPTRFIRSSTARHVAMLDIDKKKIVQVFASQQEAAIARKLKKKTAINNAINKGTLCSGHYFKFFEDCEEELKVEYLARETLPNFILPKGIPVLQISPQTNIVVAQFDSIASVLKQFHMSRNTLKRCCGNGDVHKGFQWRFA